MANYRSFSKRFSKSRALASYLRRAIDQQTIVETGRAGANVGSVDSAAVESISRASAVDSGEVTTLIDSNYIKAKIDGGYIRDYIDEEYIKSFFDSAYISTLAGGGDAPTITSVSPTSYNGASGYDITVNGTNFTIGTYVDFINNVGAEYRASSTTLVSQSQVIARTPTSFSASVDPLSVKVTTPNGTTTASNVITTGSSPSWSTSTNLGSYSKNSPVDLTVVATDPQSQPVTYQVKSGSSLPTGLSLNSNTGNITGTLNYSISSNTSVSTIITASDTSSNTTDRTFNWTITPTSSISQTINLPVLGDQYFGPTGGSNGEMNSWFETNVRTNGNFDELFYSVGNDVYNNTVLRGMWLFRPRTTLRVDYDVRGARGGDNYAYNIYGRGRRITGSFYLGSSTVLLAWVGRPGHGYYSSSFDWAACGGGGCSGLMITRQNNQFSSGYFYPVAIAAGGGGTPGGGNGAGHSTDNWSALPLDYPYRAGYTTGGRYSAQTTDAGQNGANNSSYPLGYPAGGAGWLYSGQNHTPSNNHAYLAAAAGRSNSPWLNLFSTNNSTTSYGNNYTWYGSPGGFGGGGGTWHQRQSQSSSTLQLYHKYGGGAGGYYGGYPTSSARVTGGTDINGGINGSRNYQYPYASDWNPGVSNGTSTPVGLNNNYYGAYSYALGLESTGSYTFGGGDVDGTAPSAGQTTAYSSSSTGAYWNSTLPRPTDNGLNSGDGYVGLVFSVA